MYKIQKEYYTGTNETKVRLTLQEPYRDFVVSFTGDMTAADDEILEQIAVDKLAREFNPNKAIEELEARVKAQEIANEAIVKTFILAKDLSDEQRNQILSQYPEWSEGVRYNAGNKVTHNGKIYEVIQGHTSQGDWQPDSVPALFKEFTNTKIVDENGEETEVIADFKQPTGAHDAYKRGDKVRFNGELYESTLETNAYSPSDYPQGWKKLEDKE